MLSEFKNPVRLWDKNYHLNLSRLLKVFYFEIRRILRGISYIAEIDVTCKCNLTCKHCFYFKNPDNIPDKELSPEQWDVELTKIYNAGIRRLCLVGGEPSLRPDVLKLANSKFPYIDICSNGLIKIPEEINHRIFISVDGIDAYNKQYRGKEIFKKITENYYNDKRVVVLMTLNNLNYKDIGAVAEYAISNKFPSLVFSLFTPMNKGEELYFDDTSRKNIINAIIEAKKKYPGLIKMNKFALNWYASRDHKNKCYWRDKVKHYNSLMQERNACLNMDCANCGYFSGSNIAPLNSLY
jgi:MoaA/NifB/PqqE/SkfB family radical SAM enzyme